MKRNNKEQRRRFALTVLLSAVVFAALLATVAVGLGISMLLVHFGVTAAIDLDRSSTYSLLAIMALISVIIGAVMVFFLGRIITKPMNTLINAMNRLAGGDFKTRISFGKVFSRNPAVKELTDAFNTMASELEGTQMLRSDFINSFSHEFKTPIVSIAGFAKLLRSGDLSDAEKREYLEIIEDESMRLSSMATNVLRMTKIENQTILTDVKRYNLSEQLRTCILTLDEAWTRRNIDLDIDLDEYEINANEELLHEVWLNLLDNALKFTPDGGTVGLSAKEKDGEITVTVSNTGSRIPKEKLPHIWDKFYQGDDSRATKGNGIGLAIVRSVVGLHGGTVFAESEDDFTKFTVTLPK